MDHEWMNQTSNAMKERLNYTMVFISFCDRKRLIPTFYPWRGVLPSPKALGGWDSFQYQPYNHTYMFKSENTEYQIVCLYAILGDKKTYITTC